jgi:hypothetical protein
MDLRVSVRYSSIDLLVRMTVIRLQNGTDRGKLWSVPNSAYPMFCGRSGDDALSLEK